MNSTWFFLGYFACLITGVLISAHNLILELIRRKIRALKQARLQNNEEGKDL